MKLQHPSQPTTISNYRAERNIPTQDKLSETQIEGGKKVKCIIIQNQEQYKESSKHIYFPRTLFRPAWIPGGLAPRTVSTSSPLL
jgi:hypothetical protein